MKKRLLACLLALTLVLSGQIGHTAEAYAATQLTEDNMSATILALKNKLEIGDEYTETDYTYYEGTNGTIWDFYWRTEDYSKSISASCDGLGRITSVNKNRDYEIKAPVYTVEELQETALKLIAGITPEISGHVILESVHPYIYGSSYVYSFNRIENGVEMPDNGVVVIVDYTNGELHDFEADWLYDTEIPSAEGLITKDEAAEKLGSKVKMGLKYYVRIDDNGQPVAFLAYTPDTQYIAVDAKTGKIYTEKDYWGRTNGVADTAAESKEAAVADEDGFRANLSDAEKELIEQLKDIIPAETVVENLKANPYLFIDSTLNTATWNLSNDGMGNYYWSISMHDNRPYDWENNDIYRAYAYANVDAKTGEITSFRASLKSYYDFNEEEVKTVKANYKKSECKKVFTDFVNEVNKDRFEETKLSSTTKTHEIRYNDVKNKFAYAGYSFTYDRFCDGIEVDSNMIYGAVDAVSGKIFRYGYNWVDDVTFPKADKILSAEKAFEAYVGYEGYDLVYEIVTDYSDRTFDYDDNVKKSIRLVYRTEIYPYFVDAFTGKQLDYSGEEYTEVNKDFNYSDITGSKYERAIKLLAGLGVGFEGSAYKPEKVITEKEFRAMLSDLNYYFENLGENEISSKKLTREEAAKILVIGFGYDNLAKMDIFKTGFADEADINAELIGYVAIAKGFGLIEADADGCFKPASKMTRGEAAELLVKAIGTGR